MVKVYQIEFDFDHYQRLNVEGGLPEGFGDALLRGEPFPYEWSEIDAYVIDPLLERGSFMYALAPVATPRAVELMGDLLERFGELLPLSVEGERGYHLWNVTNMKTDVLDLDRSQYTVLNGVRYDTIARPAFVVEKMCDPIVFCIPEHPGRRYVATANDRESISDFYTRYHSLGMTGLQFTEKWAQSSARVSTRN